MSEKIRGPFKIVSDGTPANTKLVDVESGETLDLGITKIGWSIDVAGVSRCVLHLMKIEVEIQGEPSQTDVIEETTIHDTPSLDDDKE